jgi:hypothetical protein
MAKLRIGGTWSILIAFCHALVLCILNVCILNSNKPTFTSTDGNSLLSLRTEFWKPETIQKSSKTHWCVLSKKTTWRSTHKYFNHFPHASEGILPCWSWFRQENATDHCGFVLHDGLTLDSTDGRKNSWQQQLVKAMGCRVEYLEEPLPENGVSPLSDLTEVQHIPNMYLQRPRYGQMIYLDHPEDAHALRRRVIPDSSVIDKKHKGNGKRLHIGIIQRTRSRIITNLDEIVTALQDKLENCEITISELNNAPLLRHQAEWFASKDVIIAVHGAALANAIFVTPGTIILQLYPANFFWQSLDPLIEQSGGIALDWYDRKEDPIVAWRNAQAQKNQVVNEAREGNVTPPIDQIIEPILLSLGAKLATMKDMNNFRFVP